MNKNIFICYKDLSTIEKYSLNWKKLNPDWKIHLFDDQKCIYFLEKTYGTIFKDIFNFIKDVDLVTTETPILPNLKKG